MGWVKPGDTVLDCFGGCALGGLDAMGMGLHWVGIELEPRFVSLGQQNIELWNRQLRGWHNLGTARIIQGDSRKIKDVIEKADLICSSPPFTSSDNRGGTKMPNGYFNQTGGIGTQDDIVPNAPGQLGSMKEGSIDLITSSPPYDQNRFDGGPLNETNPIRRKLRESVGSNPRGGYGENVSGQLGQSTTFWSASKEIVQGCFDMLKHGGHAMWVCKDYIKAGKRVPFSQNWASLCESVGFEIVCWHQAMLVKEHGVQIGLDGEDEVIQTERKSFFRRLAEKKGSPRIDFEDIICMKKGR